MKNWKTFVLGVITTALIGLSPATANADNYNSCCDPCDWSLCDQSFEVGADFIFWKPCVDDLDVAAILETDNGVSHIEYKSLCLDREPGLRVYLNMPELFCDWGLSASYTYLKSCNTAKQQYDDADDENGIITPLIFPAEPFTEEATFELGKESLELRYQEWDILFYYDILCDRCHHFTPYFGVAGIYLEQELDAEFARELLLPGGLVAKQFDSERLDTVKWDSDYWGVGLRFGTSYGFSICNGISVFAKAHASLLAGKACSTNKQATENTFFEDEEEIIFKDDDCCHFVPGYYIAAGIAYQGCWCDCDIGARLGYEFVNWQNIPNHRVFTGNNTNSELSHSSSASTRTLGYHGLLAGVTVGF